MVVDQSLVGHETRPEQVLVAAGDIRAFADAIGDANPIFRDESAAKQAGLPISLCRRPSLPACGCRLPRRARPGAEPDTARRTGISRIPGHFLPGICPWTASRRLLSGSRDAVIWPL